VEDKIFVEYSLTQEDYEPGIYYIYNEENNEYILSENWDADALYFIHKYPDPLPGFRYIQIPDYENMFSISGRGKSAKERLDELLY
jgi:hypothetical protein